MGISFDLNYVNRAIYYYFHLLNESVVVIIKLCKLRNDGLFGPSSKLAANPAQRKLLKLLPPSSISLLLGLT